jgi:hypothetical protein
MQHQGVQLSEILLDNAVNISIIHLALLINVRAVLKKIQVKGAGGVQMVVNKVSTLEGFSDICASACNKANILSFLAVEDLYDISCIQCEAFVVHMRDLVFRQRDHLYVAEWNTEGGVYATAIEHELLYVNDQVHSAREAYEFVCNCRYPTPAEAQHLLRDGNVQGIMFLMSENLECTFRIYRQHPEYVRQKLVRNSVSRMLRELALCSMEKEQKLHVDVMYIDGKKFLVTNCDPLSLLVQTWIKTEGRTEKGLTLQGQLGLLRS